MNPWIRYHAVDGDWAWVTALYQTANTGRFVLVAHDSNMRTVDSSDPTEGPLEEVLSEETDFTHAAMRRSGRRCQRCGEWLVVDSPRRLLASKDHSEADRAPLRSLIAADGSGCYLVASRFRPGEGELRELRECASIQEARDVEAEFLTEVAGHKCTHACGEWKEVVFEVKLDQPS